jgi:hypothetical protein
MHKIDVFKKNCNDCDDIKPIVYIETYFTCDGRVGLYYCLDCGNKRMNSLTDKECIVIRKS